MTTMRFKTTMRCNGCVEKATPYLDRVPGMVSWSVNTAIPDKVLTVTGDGVTAAGVSDAMAKAGFQLLGSAEST
ncbi:MAG: heavy metal-associated domain-containing protein [Gemmataceae bacterium]